MRDIQGREWERLRTQATAIPGTVEEWISTWGGYRRQITREFDESEIALTEMSAKFKDWNVGPNWRGPLRFSSLSSRQYGPHVSTLPRSLSRSQARRSAPELKRMS